MANFDFKARFISALPPLPPDLALGEFVAYRYGNLSSLAAQDAAFLVNQGMPRDAAPFLSFEAYSEPQVNQRRVVFGIDADYFPLGHNGSGDVLAIGCRNREIVYFNHDFDNARVFINSTLAQFAECLCVYQAHLRDDRMNSCLAQIARVDGAAALPGTMWAEDIRASLGAAG